MGRRGQFERGKKRGEGVAMGGGGDGVSNDVRVVMVGKGAGWIEPGVI